MEANATKTRILTVLFALLGVLLSSGSKPQFKTISIEVLRDKVKGGWAMPVKPEGVVSWLRLGISRQEHVTAFTARPDYAKSQVLGRTFWPENRVLLTF